MTIFLKRVELLGGDGYEFQCPRQRDRRGLLRHLHPDSPSCSVEAWPWFHETEMIIMPRGVLFWVFFSFFLHMRFFSKF